jgi:hypothetical protein
LRDALGEARAAARSKQGPQVTVLCPSAAGVAARSDC